MEILGGRRFVEVPGERMHELPPLLIRSTPEVKRLDSAVQAASRLVEDEELLPALPLAEKPGQENVFEQYKEQCKMDLAIQLVQQYQGLLAQWSLGDSILDWIRQCETTFETRTDLRSLLHPDVWPHAGRSSFVTLLRDKSVETEGIEPEKAVGLRLAFRQPPPIKCFSDQFLFYLKSALASTAFQTWASLSPEPVSSLPPERFHFEVVSMAVH